MDKHKYISRADLYEMVWQRPMVQLANEFGMSDRAIGKKCAKYNIPTPGIGYWAKLQAGRQLKKKPLHPYGPDNTNPVVLTIRLDRYREPALCQETLAAIAFEKDNAKVLQTDLSWEPSHPIIVKLSKSLTKQRSEKGIVRFRKGTLESIEVTEQSVLRTFRILDVIFTSLELRGHKVFLEGKETSKLVVCVFDEKFHVKMSEHIHHEPKEDYREYWKRWKYVPTGRLKFEFSGEYIQGKVADTLKRKRLDNSINQVLIRLYKAADRTKIRRAEHIENQRRRQIERELWEKKRREEELEHHRIELITSATDRWSAIKKIADYLDEVKARMQLYQLTQAQMDLFIKMLTWADQYVHKNNPVQIMSDILLRFEG